MTYYDPSVGIGSCGWVDGKYNMVVAINHGDMANGANPNANPHCGQFIHIYGVNGIVKAKVVDTCPVCALGAIDVTEPVFEQVSPTGNGRVHNVAWDWATPVKARSAL
jgi:expansin (peptidoglycan-binding protein)